MRASVQNRLLSVILLLCLSACGPVPEPDNTEPSAISGLEEQNNGPHKASPSNPATAEFPATSEDGPPDLDGQAWDIHGPDGDIGYDVKFTLVQSGVCRYYLMETCDSRGTVVGGGFVWHCGDGTELEVWSNDSGLKYKWKWRGDHYEKVGGSSHKRTYWPQSR